MGTLRNLLRKLMFWRDDTVDHDLDVEGCFTLPGAELGVPETAARGVAAGASPNESADESGR